MTAAIDRFALEGPDGAALAAWRSILILSGEHDPVTGPGQAFTRALIVGWKAAGLTGIDHRVYEGARHELFNETCREEVEGDLIAWLDAALT
jgi:alpha-beta hydrolase superfamily lysophospholipase